MPANPPNIVELTIPQCRRLMSVISGDLGLWNHWGDDSSVILDLLSFLWSGISAETKSKLGIGDLIVEEFRIYRHY